MKTMFSMGFGSDIFGSRAMNPTLGLIRPGPRSRPNLGDVLNGDDLLKQLRSADAKVAAARNFVAGKSDADLGLLLQDDYVMWSTWMATVDGAAATVSDVEERIQGVGPGSQIDVSSEDYATLKSYMEAATVLSQIVARRQARPPLVKTAATPAKTPAAAPAVRNDLTAPLLVGGGVLAIGVIALLARG